MVFYGVLFGVGASLAYVPSLTIIGHYYKRYIGIANGVVTLGSSIFSIAMPYVLGEVLKRVGLSACLRYIILLIPKILLTRLPDKFLSRVNYIFA